MQFVATSTVAIGAFMFQFIFGKALLPLLQSSVVIDTSRQKSTKFYYCIDFYLLYTAI
jgi:hypothetical protein